MQQKDKTDRNPNLAKTASKSLEVKKKEVKSYELTIKIPILETS